MRAPIALCLTLVLSACGADAAPSLAADAGGPPLAADGAAGPSPDGAGAPPLTDGTSAPPPDADRDGAAAARDAAADAPSGPDGRGPTVDGGGGGAPQYATRIFTPATTDPAITGWPMPHVAVIDRAAAPNGRLYLHMNATGCYPMGSLGILRTAASAGYLALGLSYANSYPLYQVCGPGTPPGCAEAARREILDGIDRDPTVQVGPSDAVYYRLAKALAYLERAYPGEGWGAHLAGGQPAWSTIVVAGHSQGGGNAALVAEDFAVARVVMFAAPGDEVGGQPAPWITSTHATPTAAYYGFASTTDPQSPYQLRAWAALGLGALGPPTSVDGATAPFGGAHQLTTATPSPRGAGGAHGSTVVDKDTPLAADGTPLFAPVWRYLLGP